MRQSKVSTGATNTHLFHADKPVFVRPAVEKTIKQDGIKYYLGTNGKLYEAGAFDKMFACEKLQVLTKAQEKARRAAIRSKQKNY